MCMFIESLINVMDTNQENNERTQAVTVNEDTLHCCFVFKSLFSFLCKVM